jgi:tetratricopeptide (TPR) repeat protein
MFTFDSTIRIITVATMAATLVACKDITSTPPTATKAQPAATTPPTPVEPPKPIEAPPPVAVLPPPPTVATEVGKETVEDEDDSLKPGDMLGAARKLLDEGKLERAFKLATLAVDKMPKRSAAWNTLGRTQLRLGKRQDAIASFGKAVQLNDKNPYARNNLGLALIYDKRAEEAVDVLEQAVELEPVESYMWNNLGMAYEQVDRLEEAREAYGKAAEMDSDLARQSLARLLGVKSVIKTAKVDTDTSNTTTQ